MNHKSDRNRMFSWILTNVTNKKYQRTIFFSCYDDIKMKLNNTSFYKSERKRERDTGGVFPAMGGLLAHLIGQFGPDTKQFEI